jgi:hypothetical protein
MGWEGRLAEMFPATILKPGGNLRQIAANLSAGFLRDLTRGELRMR